MTDHPTPDEIRRATFRVAFRGFDQAEVTARLEELADLVASLAEERDRLRARLGEFADRDLKSEFEAIGREVTAVLEAAREAAQSMRERAAADAARWRSEAMAEAEATLKQARADAEAMRSDAWTTGTQLLEEVQREVQRQREELERNSLAVMGEAEREAHRLTASARREAEDVLRAAKMEAERLVAQARADHDEIIASAHRQAQAAQERARALEERRAELMEEIESIRATLAELEDELEEKRLGIGLSEPTELTGKMVILDEEGEEMEGWEEGHTVRVIRPNRQPEPPPEPEPAEKEPEPEPIEPEFPPPVFDDEDTAVTVVPSSRVGQVGDDEERAEDVTEEPPAPVEDEPSVEEPVDEPADERTSPGTDEEEPEEDQPAEEEPVVAGEAAAPPAPEPESVAVGSNGADDVFDLFRRLREPQPTEAADAEEPAEEPVASGEEPEPEVSPAAPHLPEGVDPFETRERLLLPITNAALRAIKRALTEAQNEALEQIRVSGGQWAPDPEMLESAFADELDTLGDQASQAGIEAAVEMGIAGVTAVDPAPPPPDKVGVELAEALVAALESAGSGSRERQAAASRVFRGWRTDEAERRVRAYALASYHHALRQALEQQERAWQWLPAGRLCPACRRAAEEGGSVPPAHRDCSCTIVPV
ncbi:MAG: DivIVA domain-containing protein [Actinomycetes bacterium]|mgnify:CR=1 FL=1|jgi:DivIVA domain-containing protein|nr:DivIVA domain-containing protein [Acidimicrobiia bacterium]